jgi:AAA domain
VTMQVQFVALELEDFLQFQGRQSLAFAPPADDGQSGLTLVTGDGGRGKTSLVRALKLALWGAKEACAPYPAVLARGRDGGVLSEPRWFINASALGTGVSSATVRLTMRVAGSSGESATVLVTRSLRVVRGASLAERLCVESMKAGRTKRLDGEEAQRLISGLVSAGRLPLVFAGGDDFESLGRVAWPVRDPWHQMDGRHAALLRGCTPERWRSVGSTVIRLANVLLQSERVGEGLLVLPEHVAGRWSGSYEFVPGVWLNRMPHPGTELTCVGVALAVGLCLASGTRAPLVLDAPTMRMLPALAATFVEALSNAPLSQVLVFVHEGQVDELALSMWGRAHHFYLVPERWDASSSVLSEASSIADRTS